MSYVEDCDFDATFEAIMSTHRMMYSIEMNDGMGASQQVHITREEFIDVKRRVCDLRGLKPAPKKPKSEDRQSILEPEQTESLDDDPDCWLASDNGGNTVGLTPEEHSALEEHLREIRKRHKPEPDAATPGA
jgi:hypothetical protein